MDFSLSKEHEMLREMYRAFAENEVRPVAAEIDEQERFPVELHPLLFRSAQVDPGLAGARAGLYRAASDYAARFCRQVERRLRRHGRREAWHAEGEPVLRRFYRLPGRGKFEFIAQAT